MYFSDALTDSYFSYFPETDKQKEKLSGNIVCKLIFRSSDRELGFIRLLFDSCKFVL